jgi:hypothetical protein
MGNKNHVKSGVVSIIPACKLRSVCSYCPDLLKKIISCIYWHCGVIKRKLQFKGTIFFRSF